TKDTASQEVKKDVSSLRYIALSNWAHDALLEFSSSKPQDHCSTEVLEGSGNSNPTTSTPNPPADHMETLTVETPIPTVSLPVLTAYSTDSQDPSNILGDTTNSDESNGEEAYISNMETSISASPTPTLRIHKDHPKSQIIGPVDTSIQTKNKSKETLVDCPKWIGPIGTKWVLKNKKDERGIAIRNKARLVAQGHTQEEGIDYDEVFTPVARIEAIKLFLAYALFMGFIVYQMDVKSAFLYGTIDEEVYVMQPPGFQDPEFPAKTQREDFILVQVYVDDIIFGSSNPQLCREFKALMHDKFQMSAMGIMFAVCACARHQVIPKECHLHAVKRIFRYLKGHSKLGLWYLKESPFDLVAFLDSDYGGATQDRKSTTRGCQFLGRRLISWQCKKQTIVATSTTEAEYVVATSCCRQVLWIQNQLLDYREVPVLSYEYWNG
nr:hypothetical protein [Tanacetum cinerariifolium]